MDLLIYLAEMWWPLYAVHFAEVSLFILLVWAVDRWMTLDTRLRYVLYLLALAKVFVPPFYAIPLPEFLTVSDVPIGPVYAGVVSEAEVVAPVQVAPLPLAFYLFCLWTISVAVWAGVTLWKNAAFHRALSLAVPVDLTREVESLSEARDLKVYAKASLRSPLLVGIVKPRLYLPARWSSWSSEELRGVVAHELAHRDNRDIWVLIFQAIAMALFCINPLVWLLNRRLTFLRELRCDEAVLRETNLTPAEYGRLLFGFVDKRPALSALYFNESGTALKKRLEHVLNFKEDNVKRSKWQLAIPILIGLAIVPFSIREAYTQDEGSLEVMGLAEDEKKPEPTPEQQTSPTASVNDSSEILEYDEVELKPKLLHGVPTVYPEMARKEKLQGTVFLKFMVNADGSVGDVQVLRTAVYADSSGSDMSVLLRRKVSMLFHHAAIGAILQYRFKPAEHNGKVVPVWMTQPITFRLLNDEFDVKEIVDKVNVQEVVKETDKYVLRIGRRVDVLEYDEVDVKAHPINIVTPTYPEKARKERTEGKVTLKVVVNVDGSVSDVSVLEGPEVFHHAVIDAALQCQFKPAEHNGKVVPVRMIMPIEFSLDSKEQKTTPPASGDADSSKVLEFYMVEVKPKLLHSVKPVHPEEAIRDSLEGKVFLKFMVNVDGSVSDVRVLRGAEVFHQAAIDAVSQFRYKPAEHNGKPVAVWMTQPVSFRLPKQQTRQVSRSSWYVPRNSSKNFRIVKGFSNEGMTVFEVEVEPKFLHSVEPVYPEAALEDKVEGLVFLQCVVNIDGSVSDIAVMKSFNTIERKEFQQAAIDAVSQYRFKPAEHNGKPVAVLIPHVVAFRLPKE